MWYVFSGMGSQWYGMAKDLMAVKPFRDSILQSNTYLERFGIDLYKMLTSDDETTFCNTINSFVGIAAVQVWRRMWRL